MIKNIWAAMNYSGNLKQIGPMVGLLIVVYVVFTYLGVPTH